MRLADLKAYWKTAATNNLLVGHTATAKHFTCYTLEDSLSSLKNTVYPVVALEIPETGFGGEDSDNIHHDTTGAVLLLKHTKQGDYLAIQQAMEDMEELGMQMISKLYNDRKKANDDGITAPESLIKHLVFRSIKLIEVGPVFDSCYGYRLEFAFENPINLALDESKWKAATETKWTF